MNVDDAALRRLLPPPADWQRTTQRLAAVLLPLQRRSGRDHVLFTVRPAHLPSHPGQISFPGGARQRDESPLQCALRETAEELGIAPELVTVFGGLPARPSTSGFRVHALVGRIAEDAVLVPDPGEVDRLLAVPFGELRQEARWRERRPPARPDGTGYPPSPHYEAGPDVIWGLTGRLCRDFLDLLGGAAQ